MESSRIVRVGTRASTLARTQTQLMVDALRLLGHAVEIVTISTQGDVRSDVPISAIGNDGVFVRELERALLTGAIDAAVHSLKDLPTAETTGLSLACVPQRASPFDVLVSREHVLLAALPAGAVVGTSSIRRVAQLQALRSDLIVRDIRGNVDTRLRQLDTGNYDCLILAGAGLQRLGLAERITQVLRPDAFWPAIAQGALVIQIRNDDAFLHQALKPLDDPTTHLAVWAERSCLAALAGGCLAPIGAWAQQESDGHFELGACVLDNSGDSVQRLLAKRSSAVSSEKQAVALGQSVAADLLEQGAFALLSQMRSRGL